MEANHGEQIRKAGFNSVKEFVSFVAQNYDINNIRVGKRREDGSGTFLLQVTDKHENTLFIELSKDGTYWSVNSGGVFRKGYSHKKETVAKTEPQQPNNAVSSGSSLSTDEQIGISSIEPNGEPTVSDSKGNALSGEKQGNDGKYTLGLRISEAEATVNINPTDGQKEAGNYKKGHVQVGAFDVTIENPKGSTRKGVDADGTPWETTMTHTYGYIRGTKGVDGDHIDVYISSDVDGWNGRKAFVVDQYNPDGTFDEHKVMLGFNDRDEAFAAYLSNYEDGWEKGRRLDITEVNLEDFEKWIESSKRKTKPFAEYKAIKGKATAPTLMKVVSDLYNKGKEYASQQYQMKYFDVAETPSFMKSLGLTGDKIHNPLWSDSASLGKRRLTRHRRKGMGETPRSLATTLSHHSPWRQG